MIGLERISNQQTTSTIEIVTIAEGTFFSLDAQHPKKGMPVKLVANRTPHATSKTLSSFKLVFADSQIPLLENASCMIYEGTHCLPSYYTVLSDKKIYHLLVTEDAISMAIARWFTINPLSLNKLQISHNPQITIAESSIAISPEYVHSTLAQQNQILDLAKIPASASALSQISLKDRIASFERLTKNAISTQNLANSSEKKSGLVLTIAQMEMLIKERLDEIPVNIRQNRIIAERKAELNAQQRQRMMAEQEVLVNHILNAKRNRPTNQTAAIIIKSREEIIVALKREYPYHPPADINKLTDVQKNLAQSMLEFIFPADNIEPRLQPLYIQLLQAATLGTLHKVIIDSKDPQQVELLNAVQTIRYQFFPSTINKLPLSERYATADFTIGAMYYYYLYLIAIEVTYYTQHFSYTPSNNTFTLSSQLACTPIGKLNSIGYSIDVKNSDARSMCLSMLQLLWRTTNHTTPKDTPAFINSLQTTELDYLLLVLQQYCDDNITPENKALLSDFDIITHVEALDRAQRRSNTSQITFSEIKEFLTQSMQVLSKQKKQHETVKALIETYRDARSQSYPIENLAPENIALAINILPAHRLDMFIQAIPSRYLAMPTPLKTILSGISPSLRSKVLRLRFTSEYVTASVFAVDHLAIILNYIPQNDLWDFLELDFIQAAIAQNNYADEQFFLLLNTLPTYYMRWKFINLDAIKRKLPTLISFGHTFGNLLKLLPPEKWQVFVSENNCLPTCAFFSVKAYTTLTQLFTKEQAWDFIQLDVIKRRMANTLSNCANLVSILSAFDITKRMLILNFSPIVKKLPLLLCDANDLISIMSLLPNQAACWDFLLWISQQKSLHLIIDKADGFTRVRSFLPEDKKPQFAAIFYNDHSPRNFSNITAHIIALFATATAQHLIILAELMKENLALFCRARLRLDSILEKLSATSRWDCILLPIILNNIFSFIHNGKQLANILKCLSEKKKWSVIELLKTEKFPEGFFEKPEQVKAVFSKLNPLNYTAQNLQEICLSLPSKDRADFLETPQIKQILPTLFTESELESLVKHLPDMNCRRQVVCYYLYQKNPLLAWDNQAFITVNIQRILYQTQSSKANWSKVIDPKVLAICDKIKIAPNNAVAILTDALMEYKTKPFNYCSDIGRLELTIYSCLQKVITAPASKMETVNAAAKNAAQKFLTNFTLHEGNFGSVVSFYASVVHRHGHRGRVRARNIVAANDMSTLISWLQKSEQQGNYNPNSLNTYLIAELSPLFSIENSLLIKTPQQKLAHFIDKLLQATVSPEALTNLTLLNPKAFS